MQDTSPSALGIAFVLTLNLLGLVLLWFLALSPQARSRGRTVAMRPWEGPASDILLFLAVIVLGLLGGMLLGTWLVRSVVPNILGSQTPLLLGAGAQQLGVFAVIFLHRKFHATHEPRFGIPGGSGVISGVATFLIALPVINGVNFVWQSLMDWLGVPLERQDMVDLLTSTHSWKVRIALVVLACIAAPIVEEIVFRAGLFRFMSTRFPRWLALTGPAVLFALAHGKIAVFAPFVVLALILSFAYERTGRLTTCVVAHALFNLNTIAMVLMGISS